MLNVTKVEFKPNQIRIHALSPGITSMVVVDEDERMYTVDVFVTGDVRHLQAYIDRLFAHSSVTAVAVRDSVVLRGWVTQPEHLTEIVEVAEQFSPTVLNQMKVGGKIYGFPDDADLLAGILLGGCHRALARRLGRGGMRG